MRVTWRERLEQRPDLRAIAEWPVITPETLGPRERTGYLRNQRVVARALAGHRFADIAEELGVPASRISRLLDRCLGGDDSEPPALSRALVPFAQVEHRRRKRELPTLADDSGRACAFRSLLEEVPGLVEEIDQMIEASLQDKPYGQRLSPSVVHAAFLMHLERENWPRHRYPYTDESLARESVRRLFHERVAAFERERMARRSRRARLRPSTAMDLWPMQRTQIDGHLLDLGTHADLLIDEQMVRLRLSRSTLLAAIDVETTCVLGYYLALTNAPNQQDVLTLFERCIRPGPLPTLTQPGLAYAPGAAFPCTLPGAFPVSFGTIELDNAYVHQAQSLVRLCAEEFGATLHRGPPATPIMRSVIESLFQYITRHLTHRPASTTGSHPKDPKRESSKNAKNPPEISLQTLDEALAVVLTARNLRPRPVLGGATPLGCFREQCARHYVRFIPAARLRAWQPLLGSEIRKVNCREGRYPRGFINFYYARYEAAALDAVVGLVKRVRVHFDRRDIRTVRVETLEGKPIGELQAAARWCRYPHSLATRIYLHEHAAEWLHDPHDAVGPYFRYLIENKHEPEKATLAVRFGHEVGRALESPSEPTPEAEVFLPAPSPQRSAARPWSRARAAHREPR